MSSPVGKRYLLVLEAWRAVGGLVAFVLSARAFGLGGYGLLITIYAVAAIALPLVGQGTVDLAIRNGGKGFAVRHLLISLRRVLPVGCAVAAVFGVLFSLLRGPAAGALAVFVLLGELCAAYTISVCSALALGAQEFRRAAVLGGLTLAVRVATLASISWLHPLAAVWALVNLVIVGLIAVLAARSTLTRARLDPEREPDLWRDPSFGTNDTLLTVSNNGDTLLLGILGTSANAGLYGAQYRLAQYCLVPARALLSANLAQLWVAPTLADRVRLARRCAARAFIITALLATIVGLAGPLITVLGPGFRFDLPVYVLLGVAFSMRSVTYSFGDVWTAEGLQRGRTKLQYVATGVTLIAYLVLIPLLGNIGAAIGTVIAEVTMMGLLATGRARLLGARDARANGDR